VRLFVDRATAAQPDFVLSKVDCQAIVRICRELDGVPLAIELAAPLVRVLPVEMIEQRLNETFWMLKADDPTLHPRHRTMRAVIEWELRPPDVAGAGRCCKGWRSSQMNSRSRLAESLYADREAEEIDVLSSLGQLVDKSMAIFDAQRNRYRLLRSVRKYSLDRSGRMA
jgi:predicted ATPase